MLPEERLAALGITLPPPPSAVGAYDPWVRTGNLVLTSGQLPWLDGELAYIGKLGDELIVDEGYQAARLCAINAIAQLKAAADELSRIKRIVRLDGFVHSATGFQSQAQVLDGASELLNEVFGAKGRHTRVALGISEMPLNAAVQLSLTAELAD